MEKRFLFKMVKSTKVFKKGQKVWAVHMSGALAAYAIGRYKGRGRWVRSWIHWADETGKSMSGNPDCRVIGKIEISNYFNGLLNKYI